MKKVFLSLLTIVFCMQGIGQEPSRNTKQNGKAAGYASRDATVVSMMGWGIGLFAGIAALFALLDNNTESSGGQAH